jgi:HSP20 family protein
MSSRSNNKQIPVRVYQNETQLAIAAPLAGLAPEDIRVTIAGKRVTIHGRERGPHQHDLDLLKAEWSIGPCYREVVLPENVDGSLANATYGNGVLVLTLPKAESSSTPAPVDFTLESVGLARGERIGHMGHDIEATTTEEHRDRLLSVPRRVA